MTPDQRPAKPTQDAKYVPVRRDAPDKADRSAQMALQPLHVGMATKATFENQAQEREPEAGSPAGGDTPPYGSDQVRAPHRPEPEAEQYVRLTVRVDDGRLSIVDSHMVAGPLAETTVFQSGFAYEVLAGVRRLDAGAIPDLGTYRSFVNPDGKGAQRGHHTYQLSTYEFDVRVPLGRLRDVDVSKVVIALHRIKPGETLEPQRGTGSVRSLAIENERQFREVGRVEGIPDWALPSEFAPPAPPARSRARKSRDDKEGYRDDPDDSTRAE